MKADPQLVLGSPFSHHMVQEVGRRLANIALRRSYGCSDVVDRGPTLERIAIEGALVRVDFANADGLRVRSGGEVLGFELAGPDRVYHPAKARLERATALLTCEEVQEPVTARYAWADDPRANLENSSGLPALPFRTDSWPC